MPSPATDPSRPLRRFATARSRAVQQILSAYPLFTVIIMLPLRVLTKRHLLLSPVLPSLRPQYAKATQTKGNMINRQKVPCFVANAHQTLNILGAGFRRGLEGANGGEHSANTLIPHKMHFLQNIDRYGRALRSEKAPGKDSGKDNFRARRLNGAAGGSGGMGYDSLYFNLLIFRKHKFSPVCGFPIRFSPPTPSPV